MSRDKLHDEALSQNGIHILIRAQLFKANDVIS